MSGGHNCCDFQDGCADRYITRGTRILKNCILIACTFMIHTMIAIFIVGNVIDYFTFFTPTLNFSQEPSIGMSKKNPLPLPLGLGLPSTEGSVQPISVFIACIALILGVIAFRRRIAPRKSGLRD